MSNDAQTPVFGLAYVLNHIKKTIEGRYGSPFWIKAEMNKLNFYAQSGHCYPELLEKSEGKTIAQVRATLWNSYYQRINERFLELLGEPLKDGIKILFLARIKFDAQYGLSLDIIDMDPSYTLGDLEKEKNENIQYLKKQGLFDKNKKLKLPLLPQRIAVISVESSKGYADYREVLDNNPWLYAFHNQLFPAVLQGDKAAKSILQQLLRIKKVQHHFDAVAIIRGGGGDVGLSCYNDLELAKAICTFPLPVFTGIGHSTNETVCEMVSFRNAITPTKLAENLIQYFHNFSIPVKEAALSIKRAAKVILDDGRSDLLSQLQTLRFAALQGLQSEQTQFTKLRVKLTSAASGGIEEHHKQLRRLPQDLARLQRELVFNARSKLGANQGLLLHSSQNLVPQNRLRLVEAQRRLAPAVKNLLYVHQTECKQQEQSIHYLDPKRVLERGYSLTLLKGKVLTKAGDIKTQEIIETHLAHGKLIAVVTEIEQEK